MSELKAFDIVVAEEGYCEGIVKYRRAVYDKSEADKVIAEKDEEIAALKHAINMADAEYSKLQRCRDEFERHFDRQLETSALQQMINMADTQYFKMKASYDKESLENQKMLRGIK